MLPIIKRYSNRKLYNTTTKRYISLEQIRELIRQGEEIQAVDHASGDDITNVVLVQIIAEEERKAGGFLPRSVLTALVQAGEQSLATLRRGMDAPLELLRQVDVEIEKRVAHLIRLGELAEGDGERLLKQLLGRDGLSVFASRLNEDELVQWLVEAGVPTRADLKALSDRLDALAAEVESLGAWLTSRSGPTG